MTDQEIETQTGGYSDPSNWISPQEQAVWNRFFLWGCITLLAILLLGCGGLYFGIRWLM